MEEEPGSQNQVLYACVARGKTILAHHLDSDPGLATAVAESLASLPTLHRRISFAANDRMACYLVNPGSDLTYCGVFDGGFGKEESFSFLQKVADELRRVTLTRGGDEKVPEVDTMDMHREFVLVIRNLVNGANGVQQTDDDSFDDCVPLMYSKARLERRLSSGDSHSHAVGKSLARVKSGSKDKKKSKEQQSYEMREIIPGGEKVAEDDDPQAESSGSKASKLVRAAQRRWWCSVKMIVVVDVALCLILGTVWLVVCRGFKCS